MAVIALGTRMENYSIAYALAVAAAAGVSVGGVRPDINSLDIQFLSPDDGDDAGDSAHVQLKSTSTGLPDSNDHPGCKTYRLRKKDYDHLRKVTSVPRFLVVLEVPKDIEVWLTCDPEYLRMNASARWLSLSGYAAADQKEHVPVHIPSENVFTPEALRENMGSLNAK